MDKFAVKLMEQSPMAAAIIGVIIIFMRYLKDRDKANREYHKEQRQVLSDMFRQFQSEHLDARSQSRETLNRNTSALETNVSATNRNSYVIETLVKSIDGLARSNNGSTHK